MRIQRSRSSLSFRKRRRHLTCLPLTLILGLLFGVFVVSWQWLGGRLNLWPTPQPSTVMNGAQRAFESGDLDSAVDQAQQVWQKDSTRTDALEMLARALVYRSYADYDHAVDRSTALAFTTEAYERMPSNPAVMAAHAFTLAANGEIGGAARLVDRATRAAPNNPFLRTTSALIYADTGAYQRALQESRAAIAAGGSVDARRVEALALSGLGRYQEAAVAAEQAIDQNNKLLMLHFEHALYEQQYGDFDAATAAYFRVLAFDPENVKARLRMCELSSTLGERDTALEYCQSVVDRGPTWAEGWYRLGREHYLQGNFPAAQEHLNRCSTLQVLQDVPVEERIFECWYLQGRVAEIQGDCDSLMDIYDEYTAMIADTDLPQTWTYPPEGPSICADPTTRTD